VYSELLRVDYKSGKVDSLPLPVHGHIDEAFTDSREPGVAFYISSWVVAPTSFRYDPKTRQFADNHIGARGDIDANAFTVSDREAAAHDSVLVPLSLIQPKGVSTPQMTVIEAYGSYGISNLADFSTRRAAFMKEGIAYAICHVRGGG